MAGHSKWANIQHRKGRQDKLRSKLFSKLAKDIAIASKLGGPDPDMNPRLRLAINNAKGQSMPKDNIKRAVDKGAGGDSADYQELRYEGFGPSGIGIVVEVSTDNTNRSAMEVRTAFSKNGGNMGETGSVTFGFDQVGEITYPLDKGDEDAMMEAAMEAGAEDVKSDPPNEDDYDEYEPVHTFYTARDDLGAVSAELEVRFCGAIFASPVLTLKLETKMAKLNFEHDGAKYAVKGEWDGNTFTAQAFKGKKEASDPFSITKEAKGDMADDAELEAVVMNSAKDDVIAGNGVSEAE